MKKLMSFVWMCLMSISMLSAQGAEEVTLVVSGDGATKEEATHVALRSAIEQAFGCFVSANTEILNDSLVKDEIVTISNGSISSYEEINMTELDSVLLSVTLRATVSVNKLISYAKSKGSSCELSGALLTQEKRMLEMNIANTKKALNHLFTLVNEFVAKNDLYTYTLDIQNMKINGFVTAKVTCRWNENADNLDKMIKDYLSAISIDEGQVKHLHTIGFNAPSIKYWGDSMYYYGWYNERKYTAYDYSIYTPLSCVSKELRQSIQKNIDRRALILLTDNLGFVYPFTLKTLLRGGLFNSFFVTDPYDGDPIGITISLGRSAGDNHYYFLKEDATIVNLQIPDQNMAALSNIEIVPYSDSRFGSLVDSVWEQKNEYFNQNMKSATLDSLSAEDDYYYWDKILLAYSLMNTMIDYKQVREYNPEEVMKESIDFYTTTANRYKEMASYVRNTCGYCSLSDLLEDIVNELSEIQEQLTKGENLYRSTGVVLFREDYFKYRSIISE